MLFFKGKDDMGLKASLKLLDLPPDATIEDANQAYTYLHRMIDIFHHENDAEDSGDRQEDMDLLTCAYEKAVSYLSDMDAGEEDAGASRLSAETASSATDLHFTINFPAGADGARTAEDASTLRQPNSQTVETAVSITTRRLRKAESSLDTARQMVETAADAVDAANQRHQRTKQARIEALVAAKSAKTRALLLEIEAKRAMEEAIAIAEKARDRVAAARQMAKAAQCEADNARQQVGMVSQSEETSAAEVVCAEDQLEKAKAQMKGLTHTVVEARRRLQMFQGFGADPDMQTYLDSHDDPSAAGDAIFAPPRAVDRQGGDREQIMSDLLEIENSLSVRKRQPVATIPDTAARREVVDREVEKREHKRLNYPDNRRPVFSIDGRSIPIRDLSSAGMGLEPDGAMASSRLVRGAIAFAGRPPVNVTGRVVRQDQRGMGLRLLTRIGNHVLDQERHRLSA